MEHQENAYVWKCFVKAQWCPKGLQELLVIMNCSWRNFVLCTNRFYNSTIKKRFLRFLMRFRVQNAPDPTLQECLFREASCGLERKVSHIIWRHPSFEFLPTWRYFVAALRDYKPVRDRRGQILCAKSHQNRIENRMCKRAFKCIIRNDIWIIGNVITVARKRDEMLCWSKSSMNVIKKIIWFACNWMSLL